MLAPMKTPPSSRPGYVRIIAGRFKGRRIPIADHVALRPTPDRVRETLFNWLAPELPGARVLDLFAGTGVLGVEALSRGASMLVALERDPALATGISRVLDACGLGDASEVLSLDALTWLKGQPEQAFDLVFVDPPYAADAWEAVASALGRPGWLKPSALIYCEHSNNLPEPAWPEDWVAWKTSRAGQVRYHLFRYQPTVGSAVSATLA